MLFSVTISALLSSTESGLSTCHSPRENLHLLIHRRHECGTGYRHPGIAFIHTDAPGVAGPHVVPHRRYDAHHPQPTGRDTQGL